MSPNGLHYPMFYVTYCLLSPYVLHLVLPSVFCYSMSSVTQRLILHVLCYPTSYATQCLMVPNVLCYATNVLNVLLPTSYVTSSLMSLRHVLCYLNARKTRSKKATTRKFESFILDIVDNLQKCRKSILKIKMKTLILFVCFLF